ncbi:uncharacterized protein LOC144770024 [Lissotriton helveticus]
MVQRARSGTISPAASAERSPTQPCVGGAEQDPQQTRVSRGRYFPRSVGEGTQLGSVWGGARAQYFPTAKCSGHGFPGYNLREAAPWSSNGCRGSFSFSKIRIGSFLLRYQHCLQRCECTLDTFTNKNIHHFSMGQTARPRGLVLTSEYISTPAQDQAFSEDSTPGDIQELEEPGTSGQSGQTTPMTLRVAPSTSPTPAATPQQPEFSTSCVPPTVRLIVCASVLGDVTITLPPSAHPGTSRMEHTGARAQVSGGRGHGRVFMGRQTESTGVPDTQTTIAQVLGYYHQSHKMMGKVLTELQEIKQLQRELNQQVEAHSSSKGSLVGVQQDFYTHMCRAYPPPFTPFCGPTTPEPSTTAIGREALLLEEPIVTSQPRHLCIPTRKKGLPPKSPGGKDGKTSDTTSKKPQR